MILEQFLYALVDLIDQSTVNGERLNAYSIVPKNANYPYIRIGEIMRMEANPCEKNEYLTTITIVTEGSSYQKAIDIFKEVETAINEFLKFYFETQTLIRFERTRLTQIREDLPGLMATLSIKQ